MFGKLAFALALSAAPLPALAQDATRQAVDGWTIGKVDTGACQMATTLSDGAFFSFVDADTGPGMLGMKQQSWVLQDSATYPATLSLNAWKTSESVTFKVFTASSGRMVLVLTTLPEFNLRLRAAGRIALRIPGLQVDTSVTFPAATLAAVQACFKNS